MHIIKLWPGDWFKQTKKMSQAVGEKNSLDTLGGRGSWKVCLFTRNKLWKCIELILLLVTFWG